MCDAIVSVAHVAETMVVPHATSKMTTLEVVMR
jgi:hypothetical protein